MSSTDNYRSEWAQINKIAKEVESLNREINELEAEASSLRSRIASIPYEYDEDGEDIYESVRDNLESQLSSIESSISAAESSRRQYAGEARSMANTFSSLYSENKAKASKLNSSIRGFSQIQGGRFGASAARAAGKAASDRQGHYEDHAQALSELIQAANAAAQGASSGRGSASIRDRGSFGYQTKKSSGIQGGRKPSSGAGRGQGLSSGGASPSGAASGISWSGKAGESVKRVSDPLVNATLAGLGLSGLMYQNHKPDIAPVSFAHVRVTPGSPMNFVDLCDQQLAEKYGIPQHAAAMYRRDNDLEWRYSEDRKMAYLLPRDISKAFQEGRVEYPDYMGGDQLKKLERQTGYYSSYKERISHVPAEESKKGSWIGVRGESVFVPSDPKVKAMLAEYGLVGIKYTDGIPDFSPVSRTVTIENMTSVRPSNFRQSYEMIAEVWNQEAFEGKTDWLPSDVRNWTKDDAHKYTVHERNDRRTCDLVPTEIHEYFTHLGGVSECKTAEQEAGGLFDD